jgi:pimeloyl-ACP methyl ester carboxylesterase
MTEPTLTKFDIEGVPLAVRLAGEREMPAILLLHGSPSSSRSFRHVLGPLGKSCYVVAPDLPGYGDSEPIERTSFSRLADVIDALLALLGIGSFYVYLHDFGAPVGLHLATRAPDRIRGLVIQNGNAHESGLGPGWSATRAFWEDPSPEREAQAITHLNFEGTRKVYVEGVPPDIVARMDPSQWEEDWRIMALPGRFEKERALVLDYSAHVARFGEISEYLRRRQPRALMLWGRHDIFFDLDETLAWMKALPRMEAHVFDAGHTLLETHSAECAALMSAFIARVEASARTITL